MICIAIYTIIFLISLRDGHVWGGDFSLYIMHAENIVTGSAYSQTDYIYSPASAVSARSYPPATPVILAPIYAAFGLDLNAMKAGLFLFFSAALVVLFFYFRRLENLTTAWILTAVVALNPYVWEFKDNIRSELPFIFFVYSTFLLCLVRDQISLKKGRFLAACLAGMTAYLAYATRSIGGGMVAAILVHDLLHRRRLLIDTVPILVVFALGYVTQTHLMHVQPDYVDYDLSLKLPSAELILNKAILYAASLRNFLPRPDKIDNIFAVIFLLLILFGFFAQLIRDVERKNIGNPRSLLSGLVSAIRLQELFIAGYLLTFLVLPFPARGRYLFPLLPLLVFYAAAGLMAVCRLVVGSPQRWGKVACGIVAVYYLGFYAVVMAEGKPIVHGPHVPQSVEMIDFVRTELPEDAIVIFRKPRVMALFGEKASAIWPRSSGKANAESAWNYFAKIGATHLVVAKEGSGLSHANYLRYDLLPSVDYLTPVFNNDHFTIYRVVYYPEHIEPDGPTSRSPGKHSQ